MRSPTILVLFAAFASQRALAGTPGTVAIAVDTGSLAPGIAKEVQDGAVTHILAGLTEVLVVRAATAVSLTPVTDPGTLERVLACESTECLRELGQRAGIDLVVQVRVRPAPAAGKVARRAKASYVASMLAVQPLPRREGWTEQTECRGCGAGEIKHSASLLASVIAERIAIEPPPAARASEEPRVSAPPMPTAGPEIPAWPRPAPSSPPRPTLVRTPAAQDAFYVPSYLSVTAMAGGALLVGAGLYLIHIDGGGTCELASGRELCARRYKTRTAGIALLTGGGVAALGGLAGLVFFSPGRGSTRLAFNLGASSLIFSGGF